MPDSNPLVAICMATFEPDPPLLEAQIASIKAQTHERWVCLISDDGSSPERLALLGELTGDDPRFELHAAGERLGFYLNFERTLELVPPEAAFVALADQDDDWYPEKLAQLVAACGSARLAYSDMRIVDPAGAVLSETFWRGRRNNHTDLASLLLANTVTGAASLFPGELLALVLPFPRLPGDPFHDQWIASLALATGEVAYVDRPLYDYVQHGGAARGHEAAMREWSPGRVLDRRDPAGSLRRGGERARRSYEDNVLRIAAAAAEAEARVGSAAAPAKRRALRRVARLGSAGAPTWWLLARWTRRFTGRNETLGIELTLAAAIWWHRLDAARARLGGRRRDR
jgi:glycosyltransferase involved in cell wall biosynthesis